MNSQDLLQRRQSITDAIYQSPYDASLYLSRAQCFQDLGFPDLAAGDAYRTLLLIDEATDESGEYHEQSYDALLAHVKNGSSVEDLTKTLAVRSYQCLARNLRICGCCQSAHDFCERGLNFSCDDAVLKDENKLLLEILGRQEGSEYDLNSLPSQGSARRELYLWNKYEPDRFSTDSLSILNAEMSAVAPKCTVLATVLPLLTEDGTPGSTETTVKQLGIFANEDIAPGETVLHERSILTANNRLHDPLCDACSSELPPVSSAQATYACPDCDDTVFCSEQCLNAASAMYHPAICGKDIDAIGKDTPQKEAADALYLLLLSRVIALSETQSIHPLLLKETKYIWGDFIDPDSTYIHSSTASTFSTACHLPFSFTYNILAPLHLLEKMDIDIFASVDKYDFWILNTLYAKFRATASARLSPRDGRPEVSAVHPMWCLANHSCAPNVRWEWGGEIKFWARSLDEVVRWGPQKDEEKDGKWRGGIKKGEEVLNHYCDPGIDVKDRREWAVGALGGMCTCARCVWEAENRKP